VALFHDAEDHPIAFHGGLCWFHRWDIGSQDTENIGMATMRWVRTGLGVSAEMRDEPGLIVEKSELAHLRSLFLLGLIFEWDVSFVDAHGEFIIAASHDSIAYVICRSQAEKDRLVRRYAPHWEVVDNAAPRYTRTQ
jgi:hypothetical protein